MYENKCPSNVSLSIRPEKIIINSNLVSNSLKAKVITSSFVGNTYQYTLNTLIGDFYVVSSDTTNFKTLNDEVFLSFDSETITLLAD